MLSETKLRQFLTPKLVDIYDDHIPDFVHTFSCGEGNVCEVLREEVNYWNCRDPVQIDAPTGRGKTSFVYEVLIPRAIERGKNVLLISNRVAVSVQQKIKIMELLGSPLIGCLTNKGIQQQESFGMVRVITYHRLPALLKEERNKQWIENLIYVVADEVHFFAADSSFNENCDYYLKLITSKFQHAIRVYLTATIWDVLHPLVEAEKNNYRDYDIVASPYTVYQRGLYRYRFSSNYRYILLNFFDDLEEIKPLILQKPDDKWLIFVSSKQEGQTFVANLNSDDQGASAKKRAAYLDADKKDTDEWRNLLSSSMFETQVLVATSVLDCGINIWDDALKNIVIIADNRTSLLQMLGRKRCKPSERINLYVRDISRQTFVSRHKEGMSLFSWYRRYKNADREEQKRIATEIWRKADPVLLNYFRLGGGSLYPNELAFFSLGRKLRFYEQFISEDATATFQNAVREWLGMAVEHSPDYRDALASFCLQHKDTEMVESEIAEFRKLVICACEQNGYKEPQPTRKDFLRIGALNNRLAKLDMPFELEEKQWVIHAKEDTE